ncbi:c-type cytochrome [Altericroceibacterium spongiae]|nr:cytochrome c [Altericroceibacterium spongiae]
MMKTWQRAGVIGLTLVTAIGSVASVAAPDATMPGNAVDIKGRELFQNWSCGACHLMKDAGGTGRAGPSLDTGSRSVKFIASRIANGQGAMPPFSGSLTDEEIDILAHYIAAHDDAG